MRKKITIKEIKFRIKEIHGDTITLVEETYVDTRTKCKFIDKDYGAWWTSPSNVIYYNKCHRIRGKIKREKTNLDKYGVKCVFQSIEIQNNIKKTNLSKYGVEYVFQADSVKEKIAKTNIKRHGVKYYVQSDEMKRKSKKTNLEKYGVENVLQNREILLKNIKSRTASKILYHWKSNIELVCTASYEVKTVQYLNKNKINFTWQPRTFTMPDGRTYLPDCYLEDTNMWLEIKGYFWGDAKEKWNWFSTIKTNSELWDEAKLKEMGIL